jgi:excinuclease ABC subunit C
MEDRLKQKIAALPQKPGIYFFKNAKGAVIYIGKAHLLKERVKSYFQPTDDLKVRNILAETDDIDYILTDSEREAAFLENNFIQRYQPKFNLRLKDDKSFPYLKLTIKERFPGIYFSRKVEGVGAKYFGPFSPAHEARRTIHLVSKFFGIRNCDEAVPGKRKRPCLEYDLKLCSAPCIGYVTEPDYRERVENALLFLEGKTEKLAIALKEKMKKAADSQAYEEAARWRDILRTIEHIKVKPKLISIRLENQDIFGHARENRYQAVYVFFMRKGKVRESQEIFYEEDPDKKDADILRDFLMAFYAERSIPKKILLPFRPSSEQELMTETSGRAKNKIEILVPTRGKNKDLVELAVRNAEILLEKKADGLSPLAEIKKILCLKSLPVRIEGFDVSNTFGTETVASLVTFENGRPFKDGYRKYKIKTVEGPNDVASLEEVIRRRYRRLLEEKRPLPDLVLVDGGKPQLSTARRVLAELGLSKLPVASLAKKEEMIFVPSRKEGLRLDRTSAALKLFQRIRDEAHRFAISFHRQRRMKRSFE